MRGKPGYHIASFPPVIVKADGPDSLMTPIHDFMYAADARLERAKRRLAGHVVGWRLRSAKPAAARRAPAIDKAQRRHEPTGRVSRYYEELQAATVAFAAGLKRARYQSLLKGGDEPLADKPYLRCTAVNTANTVTADGILLLNETLPQHEVTQDESGIRLIINTPFVPEMDTLAIAALEAGGVELPRPKARVKLMAAAANAPNDGFTPAWGSASFNMQPLR